MLTEQLLGKILDDRYEILEKLGTGGMGAVYKAKQSGLERFVAIKFLHSSLLEDSGSRARFEREGRVLSSLSHKNIMGFYGVAFWQNQFPYMVMEYLQGSTLHDLLAKEGHLDWRHAVSIAIQVCEAMEYTHQQGVIHRDLKPNNIMLVELGKEEVVKVVDFGLARLLSGAAQSVQKLTQTGELIGSVHYLSPELCLGKGTDARSDIYALGCVLYESIIGAPPLTADNPIGLLQKHVSEKPAALFEHETAGAVPVALNNVLQKAMAKQPEDRYQSMDALKEDLELVLVGNEEGISADASYGSKPPLNSPKNMIGRSKIVAVIIVCILLSSLGFVWFVEPAPAAAIGLLTQFFPKAEAEEMDLSCARWLQEQKRFKSAALLFKKALNSRGTAPSLTTVEILYGLMSVSLADNNKIETKTYAEKALQALFSLEQRQHVLADDAHVQELLSGILLTLDKVGGRTSQLTNAICSTLAFGELKFTNPRLSQECLRLRIALVRRARGENSTDVVKDYLVLGKLFACQRLWDRSGEAFNQACKIAVHISGSSGYLTAYVNYMASQYLAEAGNRALAEAYLVKARDIFMHIEAPDLESEVMRTLCFTQAYIADNKTDKAEQSLEKALTLMPNLNTGNSMSLLPTVQRIILQLINANGNDVRKAESLYWKAIDCFHGKEARNDMAYCELLQNLADFYCQMQRYKDTIGATSKIRARLGAADEDNFLIYCKSLSREAAAYSYLERFNEATKLFQEKLDVFKRFTGAQSSEVGLSLYELGINYSEMGQIPETMKFLLQAEQVLSKHPSAYDANACACMALATNYFNLGDRKKSQAYIDKTEALFSAHNNNNMLHLAWFYHERMREASINNDKRSSLEYAGKELKVRCQYYADASRPGDFADIAECVKTILDHCRNQEELLIVRDELIMAKKIFVAEVWKNKAEKELLRKLDLALR